MPCDSTNSTRINADLYLIAGFRTAPLFMEEFRLHLHGRLEKAGAAAVRSKLLFPYGDWSRRPVSQLLEIRRDMRLGVDRLERSIGGRQVLEAILRDGDEIGNTGGRSIGAEHAGHSGDAGRAGDAWRDGGAGQADAADRAEALIGAPGSRLPILIGHSAGGVAAVHAASLLLERAGGKPCPVVMIGSPKCRIPEALRGAVLYVHAAGSRERKGSRFGSPDPVTRLGSFGGWGPSGRRGWRVWQRDKHAPEEIAAVPVAGGHADYFRSQAPFLDAEGRSNLDRISEAVWRWLAKRCLVPAEEARGR